MLAFEVASPLSYLIPCPVVLLFQFGAIFRKAISTPQAMKTSFLRDKFEDFAIVRKAGLPAAVTTLGNRDELVSNTVKCRLDYVPHLVNSVTIID